LWAALESGQGHSPPAYIEYRVMKEMGWSYEELMACPRTVVGDIIRYMNTEGKFEQRKAKDIE
jgi:hypothetical protein